MLASLTSSEHLPNDCYLLTSHWWMNSQEPFSFYAQSSGHLSQPHWRKCKASNNLSGDGGSSSCCSNIQLLCSAYWQVLTSIWVRLYNRLKTTPFWNHQTANILPLVLEAATSIFVRGSSLSRFLNGSLLHAFLIRWASKEVRRLYLKYS